MEGVKKEEIVKDISQFATNDYIFLCGTRIQTKSLSIFVFI